MKCLKCGGLTVEERVQVSLYELLHVNTLKMRRCVNCGAMFDHVTILNKLQQKVKK